MMMAQLMNILYNIVDRIFLGHMAGVGKYALAGVGLCLPILSVIMAFANLCGTGGGALCSIRRGEGDLDEAEAIAGNCCTLLLLFGAVLTLVSLLCKDKLLVLFGASDVTFPYADQYLTIYLIGTVFVMLGLGLNPIINSQGFGRVGMMTVGLGALVNLVLDPVFIYVLGMGVRGAALATVIAQGCSAFWAVSFLRGKKAIVRLKLGRMKLRGERVKAITALGLPGFFVSITDALVSVAANANLYAYGGNLYVSVMTVINSVRSVVMMPLQGLANGAQPVLGYNYGARKYDRVSAAIRFTVGVTVAYSLAAWLLIMGFPAVFIRLFNNDADLVAAGVRSMRIFFAVFFMMAFQFSSQAVFVSLGRAKNAIFFSLLRKAFVVAPLTFLLPALGMGVNGVFTAEAISHVVGGAACFATMLAVVYFPMRRQVNDTEWRA